MRAAPMAVLLLAACSSEPQPAPTPTASPAPSPSPAPAAAPAIDDRAQPRPKPGGVAAAVLPAPELEAATAAGRWTLKASATGAAALFGPDGAEPRLAVRCDPQARSITFVLPGAAGEKLRIVTANGSATFAARGGEGGLIAEAPAQYTFLTQTLARAPGGFAAVVDGGGVLRVPGDAAVDQVIRSCQPG